MSVNYASALSPYEHKGRCGMPEKFEEADAVIEKSNQLAEMIQNSRHFVVITGAGISTSAGIPDFRGPSGVWTLEQKGRSPEVNITFETARPTISHLALVALENSGYLKYLISQNVDGLHLRSGFPRNRLAELHGDMFVEECDLCKMQYIRNKPVATMTLQLTGELCTQLKHRGKCRGRLRDTILDWEDALPVNELDLADKHCRQADLCLCLGTSLQIMPCGGMPLLTKKNSGRIVVVNLQTTRIDKSADLRLHARVDDVMLQVCKSLGVSLPEWKRPVIVVKSTHTSPDEPVPRVVVSEFLNVTPNGSERTDDVKKIVTCKSLVGTLATSSATDVDGESDSKVNESFKVDEMKCSSESAARMSLDSTPSVEIKVDSESDESGKRLSFEQMQRTEEQQPDNDVDFVTSLDRTSSTARALKRKLDT